MKLRAWFSISAYTLGVIAIVAVCALLLSVRGLVDESRSMRQDLETVQRADLIAVDLLGHRRQQLQWIDTGDAARLEAAAEREHEVLRGLAASWVAPSDQLALDESTAAVRTYLAAAARVPLSALAAPAYKDAAPAFARAEETLEGFSDRIAARAARLQRDAEALQRRVDWLGLVVLCSVFAIVLATTALIENRLVRPVKELLQSIRSFDARRSLLREALPGEFGEIERALHEMSATIERQQVNQMHFISSVAHDLRTPLAAMKGYCWLARREAPLPPEESVRLAFEVIGRQVDRLNHQIGELLDRSRFEAGAFDLDLSRTNVAEIVREVCALFESVAPNRMTVDAPPSLFTQADASKLQRAVANLISNAIKYSPDGGSVAVRARKESEQIVVEVEDRGIGIDAADLASLFEPFRRGRQALALELPGVGLGLSATKRILEAHGGNIEIESTAGVGTTFRIRLPAHGSETPALAG